MVMIEFPVVATTDTAALRCFEDGQIRSESAPLPALPFTFTLALQLSESLPTFAFTLVERRTVP